MSPQQDKTLPQSDNNTMPASSSNDIEQDDADVYEEDSEDFRVQKRPKYARFTALLLGLLTLASVGIGIYFFLDHNDYSLTKAPRVDASTVVLALRDIALHTDPQDCWMGIHGRAYDMTEYAPRHPGAPTLITNHCGTDATRWFNFEHTVALLPLVDRYVLGTLAVEEEEEKVVSVTQGQVLVEEEEESVLATAEVQGEVQEEGVVVEEEPAPVETAAEATDTPSPSPSTTSPQAAPPPPGTEAPIITAAPITPSPTTPRPTTDTPTTPEPTAAPDGCPMNVYTLDDLAQHNDEESCWYGLYGVVYDLTWYVDDHKGGRGVILADCGKDATVSFVAEKKHDVDMLVKKGFVPSIIGRVGETTGVVYVPCEEVELPAVTGI